MDRYARARSLHSLMAKLNVTDIHKLNFLRQRLTLRRGTSESTFDEKLQNVTTLTNFQSRRL